MTDYYAILGLEHGATEDEVRRAYRREIIRHHPDRPGGDEERARMIKQARTVLLDPDARSQHDRRLAEVQTPDADPAGALIAAVCEVALGVRFSERTRGAFAALGSELVAAQARTSASPARREVGDPRRMATVAVVACVASVLAVVVAILAFL